MFPVFPLFFALIRCLIRWLEPLDLLRIGSVFLMVLRNFHCVESEGADVFEGPEAEHDFSDNLFGWDGADGFGS